MASFGAGAQEIIWKGKELISGNYKLIEGEIIIRTPEDTVRASKAKLYNAPEKRPYCPATSGWTERICR